jgi:hypothetical protein
VQLPRFAGRAWGSPERRAPDYAGAGCRTSPRTLSTSLAIQTLTTPFVSNRSVPGYSRSKLLAACPGDLRQAVLDEVEAMYKAGKVRNPIGLLSVLARKAGLGQFAPNYSMRVDTPRPVTERRGEARGTQRQASRSVGPTAVSELGRRVLSDLRKRLSPEVAMDEEAATHGRVAE